MVSSIMVNMLLTYNNNCFNIKDYISVMDLRPMLYLKIGLIVGVILVTIMYLQEQGNIQKNSIQVKISLLKQENEAIEKEIRQLEQKISKLRSDPKTVEKVAKRKLGMVRQDETIYIFHLNDDKK